MPDLLTYVPLTAVDRMPEPGAATSTHAPRWVSAAGLSPACVLATDRTFGQAPGHCWKPLPLLPAAVATLWQEGVTSFDISDKTVDYVASLIDGLEQDPEFAERMGRAAAERFREIVSFDEEEQAIRRMFEAVL